ncbi:UNVERIFIED_CONTAM: hypothetical protein Sradi_0864200 [Sesamum radiatum]|uniref:Uncharacterized protein n=1 Tax=Sesamum radiatum TaxID=300843 RepID=A0AAW2V138_SESRA
MGHGKQIATGPSGAHLPNPLEVLEMITMSRADLRRIFQEWVTNEGMMPPPPPPPPPPWLVELEEQE